MAPSGRKTAGQILRAWREAERLSQAEAAALVGVQQSTWSDWENDRKLPRIDHGLRIAQVSKGKCPIEIFLLPMTGTDG